MFTFLQLFIVFRANYINNYEKKPNMKTQKQTKQVDLDFHEQDQTVTYLNNERLPAVNSQYAWTKERLKELDKARKNISHFAQNYFFITTLDEGKQKIKLYKAQKRILKSLEKNRFVCLLASRQVGKALALDTPIPTPNGWTTMGEIKDGDVVFDNNGEETNVVKAWDVMYDRPCYKITFDNGEEIIADEEHLWFGSFDKINNKKINTKEIFISKSKFFIPSCKKHTENDFITIKTIEPVESVPVRCITVDSDDAMFLCGNTYIPTSNTTMMTIFALWMVSFTSDYRVIIVANKEATAKNILKRIKLAYEYIPNWIKPTIKQWDVKEVVFGNDSSIAISTTTSTAARGDTANCVDGDTIVTIKDKENDFIFDISMENLYDVISKEGEEFALTIVDEE